METYKKESDGEWVEELFWMRGMSMCRINTEAGLSLLEELGTDNSVSRLILSNNFII